MGTRDNGVREYGFILDTTLLLELLSKEENKEKVKEFLDWLEVDKIEDLDNIGLCDIAQEIGFSVYGQFTGETYNYNGTDKEDNTLYFESDDMFIIFLQKDTLFQKYEDWNEIFIEIINTLSSYGIKVDLDFVKKYTGEVSGSYWG